MQPDDEGLRAIQLTLLHTMALDLDRLGGLAGGTQERDSFRLESLLEEIGLHRVAKAAVMMSESVISLTIRSQRCRVGISLPPAGRV